MKNFLTILVGIFLAALLIFFFFRNHVEEQREEMQAPERALSGPAAEGTDDFETDPFEDFKIEAMIEDALTSTETDPPPFLETDYEPLAKWFNERFEVDYKAMTPELIFDQVPLNDIFYERSDFPRNPAPFQFQSENTSRRELLKEIAEFWNLDMTLVIGEDGHPTAVAVSGNGPRLE